MHLVQVLGNADEVQLEYGLPLRDVIKELKQYPQKFIMEKTGMSRKRLYNFLNEIDKPQRKTFDKLCQLAQEIIEEELPPIQ